jgi:hypothetical protein
MPDPLSSWPARHGIGLSHLLVIWVQYRLAPQLYPAGILSYGKLLPGSVLAAMRRCQTLVVMPPDLRWHLLASSAPTSFSEAESRTFANEAERDHRDGLRFC